MEYTLPLPASESVWRAPNAMDWASIYRPTKEIPSLSAILEDPRSLEAFRDMVDFKLTHTVILYGFWSQIWNYHDGRRFQSGFRNRARQGSAALWCTSRYQELALNLTMVRDYYASLNEHFAYELLLVAELFCMLLQVSFVEIQQVAGKASVEEAQQSFNTLQAEWLGTREARCAVWHAGQVLRATMNIPPTTLRDFSAIALYQASLCLWAYGFITGTNPNLNSSLTMSMFGQPAAGQDFPVVLDGLDTPEKRMFIEYGQGIPCVTMQDSGSPSLVPLNDGGSIMQLARTALRRSFPAGCSMPPLVENLSSLMEDLGELSRHGPQSSK